jgi:hypothetical protein
VIPARRLPIVTDDRPGVVRAEPCERSPRVRAHTVSVKRLSKRELERGAAEYPEQPGRDYLRPRTFEECDSVGLGDLFPCPFVSCKHHLYLDVNPRTGSIKFNFPGREVDELPATCALRVAQHGGRTLDAVAEVMALTRQRLSQLEDRILDKIRVTALDAAEDLDD